MTATLFTKWFKEKLLPNLKESSLIIMDNAAYHSVKTEKNPPKSWNKTQLQAWLTDHDVFFEGATIKKELLVMCGVHKTQKPYELDEFVAQNTNHRVLRLPHYHAYYNPIELIWGIAKVYFDKHVGRGHNYSEEQTETIWLEALDKITSEKWKRCCEHVESRILNDYDGQVLDNNSSNGVNRQEIGNEKMYNNIGSLLNWYNFNDDEHNLNDCNSKVVDDADEKSSNDIINLLCSNNCDDDVDYRVHNSSQFNSVRRALFIDKSPDKVSYIDIDDCEQEASAPCSAEYKRIEEELLKQTISSDDNTMNSVNVSVWTWAF